VKDLYDKMLESVKVKRSMPPNAWLWSMISNCKHHHDISLLFDILQNLRRFVSFYSLSLSLLSVQLSIYLLLILIQICCYGDEFNLILFFVSRGYRIFAYMIILTAISVVKLLKHVFMLEPLILVCFICLSCLDFAVYKISAYE
jgi:hypothetical protein